MKAKKLVTILTTGALMLTLAACGNSSSQNSSNKSSDVASSKATSKKSATKAQKSSSEAKSSSVSKSSSSKANGSNGSSSSSASSSYTVSSMSSSANGMTTSSVTPQKQSSSSQQATMSATDAKNIVKEHIGNQLNNRGVAGQSTSDLPSIDSVDSYTATQNGANNWTVSGNGHTYHVTSSSVTGN